MADREELRRAFINVLRNASQAMEENGTIDISTRSDTSMITVVIADRGPGIPEDLLQRVFEPSVSTKHDGMGLGLTLVKKTVEDMGGTIRIESRVGHGTKVIMTLPTTSKGAKQ